MTDAMIAPKPWYRLVLDRWTVLVAALLAVATFGLRPFGDGDMSGVVDRVAHMIPLLPLLYLIPAKLERPKAVWPALGVCFVIAGVSTQLDAFPPSVPLSAIALVVLVWGLVDGQLRRDGQFRLQALAMLAFGAMTLVALALEPDVARYMVASAWVLHGLWDIAYLRLNKVVARSYAECCCVLDIAVGALLFAGI